MTPNTPTPAVGEERLRELRDMCASPNPFLTETVKKPFTHDLSAALSELLLARAEIARLTIQNNRLIKEYAGRDSVACACQWSLDGDTVIEMCMAHHKFAKILSPAPQSAGVVACERAINAMQATREYFDQRADILDTTHDDGSAMPNEEMGLLAEVNMAIAALSNLSHRPEEEDARDAGRRIELARNEGFREGWMRCRRLSRGCVF